MCGTVEEVSTATTTEAVRRAQVIAANSTEVVYEVADDHLIAWVSPTVKDLLGWTPEQIAGTDLRDLTHPDDVVRLDATRAAVRTSRTSEFAVALRLRSTDGDYRSIAATMRPASSSPALGAVTVLTDVHEHVATLRALDTLTEANRILVRARDEGGLLQRMCDAVVVAGDYTFAWYGRPRFDVARSVVPVAWARTHLEYLESVSVSWGEGPLGRGAAGRAIRTGQSRVVEDIDSDPDCGPWLDAAQAHQFRCMIALPVQVGDDIDGVLAVYSDRLHAFDGRARALLEDLAADVGYGLGRLRDAEAAASARRNSIGLLEAAVESRDPYTAGHQAQVAALSGAIGRTMSLPVKQLEGLTLGASVHDVGKIAVPSSILTKVGPLTDREWQLLRRHAATGAEITRKFAWPWPIAEMIHQHHERLDGSGYPRGLDGADILLEASIIAVADVYDAMAHDRPYRAAPGQAVAREVITTGRGTKFHPDVVDAFEAVLADAPGRATPT